MNRTYIWVAAVLGCFFFCNGCALRMGKQPRQEITSLYSARSPEFRQAAGSLLGPNFVSGNNIATLVNGNQIFPAMLSGIGSAKRSINLESYVFIDGQIAQRFAATLAERARAGIKVNLILDAQGKLLRSFGDGLFTLAHGLRIDAQDNIWVTDAASHTMIKFSHDGVPLLKMKDHLEERTKEMGKPAIPTSTTPPAAGGQ